MCDCSTFHLFFSCCSLHHQVWRWEAIETCYTCVARFHCSGLVVLAHSLCTQSDWHKERNSMSEQWLLLAPSLHCNEKTISRENHFLSLKSEHWEIWRKQSQLILTELTRLNQWNSLQSMCLAQRGAKAAERKIKAQLGAVAVPGKRLTRLYTDKLKRLPSACVSMCVPSVWSSLSRTQSVSCLSIAIAPLSFSSIWRRLQFRNEVPIGADPSDSPRGRELTQ